MVRTRMACVSIVALLLLALAASLDGPATVAQDSGPDATIAALQTRVAELKGTSSARGEKINVQRTQIAEQKSEIANLQSQIPPTSTPAPVLTGKEAFPYVANGLEIMTRPGQHIGEKMSFCGFVHFIQVAGPGEKFYIGDNVISGWETVAQIFIDGVDAQFMVGFNGDSSGIYENSYVCAWGTLVDTYTGSNALGGSIQNPLFDAEYFELV